MYVSAAFKRPFTNSWTFNFESQKRALLASCKPNSRQHAHVGEMAPSCADDRFPGAPSWFRRADVGRGHLCVHCKVLATCINYQRAKP